MTQEQHRETVLRKLRVDLGCVLSEAEEGSQAVYSTGSDSLDGLLLEEDCDKMQSLSG